ncbi:hypothetical protein CHUAL_005259 [Chamberlinius hualienensis]
MLLIANLIVCFAVVLTTAYRSPIGQCTAPGQFLPDSQSCYAFYECDSDLKPELFICSDTLCWNQLLGKCDYPENVPCCSGGGESKTKP